jgi:hypothetical protein
VHQVGVHPDDAGFDAAGPDTEHAVEPVLPGHRAEHRVGVRRHPDDSPVAAGRRDRVLGVNGLVGPVEGAEADVHDPGADAGLQPGPRAERQAVHSGPAQPLVVQH